MKKVLLLVLMACFSLLFSACGMKEHHIPEVSEQTSDVPQETETVVEPTPELPDTNSKELNLYSYILSSGRKYIVNGFGGFEDQYSFDQDGNIVDSGGRLLIVASNVENYRPIRTMYFSQESYQLLAEGDRSNSANELSSTQVYSNCVVELYCAPASATNGVVCVQSDSEAVIEIRPNSNARFVNIGQQDLDEGEIAIRADDLSRPIQIYVRVLTNLAEKATIHARSLDRTAEAECIVSVELTEARRVTTGRTGSGTGVSAVTATPTPSPAVSPAAGATEFVNASGNPANHIHSFSKTVTLPTVSEMGYTTYTCTGCGYSYRDDYVSKLVPDEPAAPSHVHSYVGTVIPATETDQGYTLFVCDVCGDSYKANYTSTTVEHNADLNSDLRG